MKVKEMSEKLGLKLNIQETKIMASGLITSWQVDGKTEETGRDVTFLGSQTTKSLWLDGIWRSLGGPWPSFLWVAPCKHTDRAILKFKGKERGQDYLASKICMMHSRLLSLLHNVFVLLHLLLKFNSWEYLYVYRVLKRPSMRRNKWQSRIWWFIFLPTMPL